MIVGLIQIRDVRDADSCGIGCILVAVICATTQVAIDLTGKYPRVSMKSKPC